MPHGGLKLGKIACLISVVLPHAHLLFVQRDVPLPNQQGASWSHRWSWFPATLPEGSIIMAGFFIITLTPPMMHE